MKNAAVWPEYLDTADPGEVFAFLVSSLNQSICIWDWFVNWKKVYKNVKDLQVELNTLNYAAGATDAEQRLLELLQKQPKLVRVIPILAACRLQSLLILSNHATGDMTPESFAFSFTENPTDSQLEAAVRFARETGVCALLEQIKSVPDYVMGVEVGLDSNGRKNRTGKGMENIVGGLLKGICNEHGYDLLPQAKPKKILERFGKTVQLAKASRGFDFAVHANGRLYLIETNYYSGGGTKLKSTAGEYAKLSDVLTEQGHVFIWITDGLGWNTTLGALRDTFDHVEYVLNLKMVGLGILSAILDEAA